MIVLGLTFNEYCPDLRNSKVIDAIRELDDFGCGGNAHEPIADSQDAIGEYGVAPAQWEQLPKIADASVLAIAQDESRSRQGGSWLRTFVARGAGD